MVTFNEHREPFMIKSLGCRLVALTGWTSTNLFGIGDFNAGFEQAECCEEIMLLTILPGILYVIKLHLGMFRLFSYEFLK